MPRAAAVGFALALCVAWYVHVVNRAGNGPGLQWSRIPIDGRMTATVTAVLYGAAVLVFLLALYATRLRALPSGRGRVLLSTSGWLAAAFALAVPVGVALAEWYCLADERAFLRETRAFLARAAPDPVTHAPPLYTRRRWWPGDAQDLVSPQPDER